MSTGFDQEAYVMGQKSGYRKGYEEGYEEGEAQGAGEVVITGSITCTDPDNDGNIIITEG